MAAWGNSYIYTATTGSQLSAQMQTNKVCIATSTAILVNVGNASVTANAASGTGIIIPGNSEERSFYVGIGNYVAYTDVSGTTPQKFSITEVGI